jgi:hypothetical protein
MALNPQSIIDQLRQARDRNLIEAVAVRNDPANHRLIIDVTLNTKYDTREQYSKLKQHLEAKRCKVSDISLCNRLFYIFIDK